MSDYPTYGDNEYTVHEQNEGFIDFLLGEYEVQTVDVNTVTVTEVDGITTTTTVVTSEIPTGIGSLDFLWFGSALIIGAFVKVSYDFLKFSFTFLLGSRGRKRLK